MRFKSTFVSGRRASTELQEWEQRFQGNKVAASLIESAGVGHKKRPIPFDLFLSRGRRRKLVNLEMHFFDSTIEMLTFSKSFLFALLELSCFHVLIILIEDTRAVLLCRCDRLPSVLLSVFYNFRLALHNQTTNMLTVSCVRLLRQPRLVNKPIWNFERVLTRTQAFWESEISPIICVVLENFLFVNPFLRWLSQSKSPEIVSKTLICQQKPSKLFGLKGETTNKLPVKFITT